MRDVQEQEARPFHCGCRLFDSTSCVPAGGTASAEDAFRSSCHALLAQSHLCPFLASVQPVLWDLDHTLSLFPPPDALVVAEPGLVHSIDVSGVRYGAGRTLIAEFGLA